MKNNLENAFREKLSEFEAPYDPKAWDAVKNKLDAKSTGGNSSFGWKWIAASAVVATIAITSIFVLDQDIVEISSSEKATNKKDNINSKKDFVENSQVDLTVKNENNHSVSESLENDNKNNKIEFSQTAKNDTKNESIANNEDSNFKSNEISEDVNSNNSVKTNAENNDLNNIQESTVPNKFNYVLGNVTKHEICRGEQITIKNIGAKNDIVRFEVEGQVKELKKAENHIYNPTTSIVINFIDKNNNIIDSEYIRVNELPNPDFSTEANIFENGLPIIICEVYGDYEKVVWQFDNNTVREGNKVKHHFFEKGTYPITLKVTDFKGCENTKIKEVRIEDQYNLMAVDAFKPNGSDYRNRSFMPFSLTQRDVNFTLTIIDPRDNDVIFTSKETSNPWTGKDERTGKMTESETVFIWKVQIENPLPNERPVYAGTVVHN